jgi:filamentous hemagglutinin
MITALSMLTSGGVAALLGRDSQAAATAAQNEALNNATSTGPARGMRIVKTRG